jgi:hypothetical protein
MSFITFTPIHIGAFMVAGAALACYLQVRRRPLLFVALFLPAFVVEDSFFTQKVMVAANLSDYRPYFNVGASVTVVAAALLCFLVMTRPHKVTEQSGTQP